MTALLLIETLYLLLVIFTIIRIMFDTRSGAKALAYILFVVFVPVVGILFYFWFGVNYRKRKLYDKKIIHDEKLRQEVQDHINTYQQQVTHSGLLADHHRGMAHFIFTSTHYSITSGNEVELLVNGDKKFAALINALQEARHHIHLEYYIYESDTTGTEIAEILMKKAQQGVQVRLIYDDFGSYGLGKKLLERMKQAGVQVAPFYKVTLLALANRINYRNHRKIVVVDGHTSFVGGINISSRYRNDVEEHKELYWRDTHLKISGRATAFLQSIFISDWNFCTEHQLELESRYFPERNRGEAIRPQLVQVVPSGPDSDSPTIYYSLIKAISSARHEILITSPYFIPGQSLMDALMIAASSGVAIKIIVPQVSDSRIVNAVAASYYTELLPMGVKIYRYQKGFVHAKTMVVDNELSIVGTANMDYRSFNLNFEVNALVYGQQMANELCAVFWEDLKHCEEIDAKSWSERPAYTRIVGKVFRLASPLL